MLLGNRGGGDIRRKLALSTRQSVLASFPIGKGYRCLENLKL